MPDNLNWNQFGAGWIPSDDAVNGRKNGCLKMDNLELDQNGALTLAGGTTVEGSAYANNAHTLYSNILGGSRKDYVADTGGGIFRNGSSIGTGGDSANAAFGAAYNFTLVASGNKRLKDNGTTTVNLGVAPNAIGIDAIAVDGQYVNPVTLIATAVVDPTANGSNLTSNIVSIIPSPTTNVGVVQSYTIVATPPVDLTAFSSVGQISGDPSLPGSISTLPGATNYSGVSSQDTMTMGFNLTNGAGVIPNLTHVASITIDILLVAPDSSGDIVSDYFTQTWTNSGSNFVGGGPGVATSYFQISLIRGDGISTGFQRVGSGIQGWESAYGYRVTVVMADSVWSTLYPDFEVNFPAAAGYPAFSFLGALHSLNGSYQFVQVNVNNTGSYEAKSILGLPSGSLNFTNQLARITPHNPVSDDAQCNEAWIYAIGGTLDQWYRIMVFNSTTGFTTNYWTGMSDIDLIELDLVVNLNLVSIASSGISAKIFDILGPIEGRWFYFTANTMYPSDINDPDLVDVSLGVTTSNSAAEIFLWARRAAANQVWVGTSRDIYILAGTFETLADGSIDVFFQSLSAKFPPISYDASSSGNAVFYLAADGWRSMDAVGNCTALTPTNTDRLYRGITCYGYSVNVQVVAGSTRFPCVIARNKLWCSITGQSRMEVLDPVRSYWRNFAIGKGDCLALCSTQDGNLLGFFASDKKLRVLDVQSSLEIDGSTAQTVNLLSPVFDNSTPRQRKDLYTLKVRANTGGTALTVSLIDDTGTSNSLGTITTTSLVEVDLDVSQVIERSKWFQFSATGAFSNLTIDDFELLFDTRPIPLTFVRLYNNNFGSASKKRLRVWPHIIDTTGNNVTFTPINDNSAGATTTLNTTDKTTALVFYKTDIFAIDYGATLYCDSGTFEYWGALDPDIVQVLPIARQFDQVGPEELFRYGRVKKIILRVLAYGTSIPYTMYFDDNNVSSGNIVVPNGQETTVDVGLPMGNAGSIVRVVFGPTSFNFHRFYMRALVTKSGSDTDATWVTIPDPSAGEQ